MALHGHGFGQTPNLGEPTALTRDFIPQGQQGGNGGFAQSQGQGIDLDLLAQALRRRFMGQTPPNDIRHTLFEGQSPFAMMEQDSVFGQQFEQDFSIPPPFIDR